MRTEELMIGNLVQYNGFRMTIAGIQPPWPREDPKFDGKHVIDLFDGAGIITAALEEVEPLEITEELLIELGFMKEKRLFGTDTFWNEGIGVSHIIEERWQFKNTFNKMVLICHSVHEMQNIFYILSKKKLGFKKE